MAAQPNPLATGRPVFVVDGSRTPFLRTRGKPGSFHASISRRRRWIKCVARRSRSWRCLSPAVFCSPAKSLCRRPRRLWNAVSSPECGVAVKSNMLRSGSSAKERTSSNRLWRPRPALTAEWASSTTTMLGQARLKSKKRRSLLMKSMLTTVKG